jgi:ArsR family transcriptional regulator, virulence genes transcriptional regulator
MLIDENFMLKNLSLEKFKANSGKAASMMKALGNEKRLMILCKLIEQREMSVMAMAGTVNLSQSALSQHLALMRAEGLVDFRRNGQTLYYKIADQNVKRIIKTLKGIYCD